VLQSSPAVPDRAQTLQILWQGTTTSSFVIIDNLAFLTGTPVARGHLFEWFSPWDRAPCPPSANDAWNTPGGLSREAPLTTGAEVTAEPREVLSGAVTVVFAGRRGEGNTKGRAWKYLLPGALP